MNLKPSEKLISTEPAREPITVTPIDKVLRQITLADGHTRPYQKAQIDVVTLSSEALDQLGAIALYALKDREAQLDTIDNDLRQQQGFGINEVDALYHIEGQSYAPPIVELLPGADINDLSTITSQNSQIVDGLHRILRSRSRGEPITVAVVRGVSPKNQLPFASVPLSEVAIVEAVPETKRVLANQSLTPEKVRSLYRNFSELGSNHREETTTLRPLIPWDVLQVQREEYILEHWSRLTKDLKPFVPPIPSVLDPPPTRIMIDPFGEVHGRNHHLSGFGRTVQVSDHLAVGEYHTWRASSGDFHRRMTPAMGFGEAVLVDRAYWQQTATKLVTQLSSSEVSHIPVVTTIDNLEISQQKGEKINFADGSKDNLDKNDRKTSFVKLTTPSGNVFVSQMTDAGRASNLVTLDKTVLHADGEIVLRLKERTLFGINYYGMDDKYPTSWLGDEVKSRTDDHGPNILASSETTQFVHFTLKHQVGDQELPNISLNIIDNVAKTSWYNPGIDNPVPHMVSDAAEAAVLERQINQDTVWSGKVSPQEVFRFINDGLIPDPSTIVGAIISLLPNIEIEQDTHVVMETKETPYGNIYVLPTLPLNEAKTVNSMKLPTSFTRMDMSFTLTQTNTDKLSSRTSTGKLCCIRVVDLMEKMTEAHEHIPFDVETLAHVFSSLVQTGKIRIRQQSL